MRCVQELLKLLAMLVLLMSIPMSARAQFVDNFDPGASHWVYAIAVQTDGKIILGGEFVRLGGGGVGVTTRYSIGRVNADGTLDASFDPGVGNNGGCCGTVDALLVQPDGKTLVGGSFTSLGGGGFGVTSRNNIGRLNPDGSVDVGFNPGSGLSGMAGGSVRAMALQPDGKILVGGRFSTLGGGGAGATTRNYIGRLNSNGTLDTGFNPDSLGAVNAIAVQADGKILIGGEFSYLGGGAIARSCIARLNPNGTVDNSFDPGANSYVNTMIVQADGKIVVGGWFSKLGGGGPATIFRNCIGRLNSDGTIDESFNPGAGYYVNSLALQPDSKILVGGVFTTLGGGGTGTTTRNYIGRVNANGSLDTTFDPVANSYVNAIAVQADGKILVGGTFGTLGGGGTGTTIRNCIGRLTSTLSRKTGVFRPSTGELFLKNANSSGFADTHITFGNPGDYPLAGDWNGDAIVSVGIYRNGVFHLRNTNSTGVADIVVPFGNPGDQPIAGDWNGDGVDTIGVYRNGTFLLCNSNTAGPPDLIFTLGNPGDVGIAGDWNGDGITTCGVFRPSNGIVYLRNSNTTGFADLSFVFGNAGDKPVAGDWNGDGIDTIGIYRNGVFYLSNSNTTGFADIVFVLGNSGDFPIAGNWNGQP